MVDGDKEMKRKGKAIVVGGSIAGVSCAHALSGAGWEVVVVEKSSGGGPTTTTGAGLGLDPLSCKIIHSWLTDSASLLYDSTIPLSIDQNQAADVEKVSLRLTRDEDFNFRAAHWSDLHALLLRSLPPRVTFLWGHHFISFNISDDKASVIVNAKVLQTGEIVQIVGDLLVAADGCLSSIRQTYLPHHKLRHSNTIAGMQDIVHGEGFLISPEKRILTPLEGFEGHIQILEDATLNSVNRHIVLYELLNKRMNWIWYVTQPKPEMKGNSVTMKVSKDLIMKMCQEADEIWAPELAQLINSTPEPFINAIYDSDPLDWLFYDNLVVLVGDAAHPRTPHCLRSTNMSIHDAAVLGKCLEKWGVDDLKHALKDYQSIRLPVVSKQVLHARKVGRVKQGLSRTEKWEALDVKKASDEDCSELQQKNVPFFSQIPDVLLS